MTPNISIIIPNFNGATLLEKNMPFVVKAYDNPKNNIKEIIVVDDGSSDNSVQVLTKNFSQVKIIKHKINRGFSSAVNTGVRTAKGEYVVLINTDVLPAEDFLEKIQKNFEDKKVFAVSFNEQGYSWAKGTFTDGYINHEVGSKVATVHPSFWASGGSAIFRREAWIKLGGMDERLYSPFYWEDVDLSYRAQKRGMIVLWDPEAKVVHEHESTISKISKSFANKIRERNQLLFVWKNITSKNLFKKHLEGLFMRIVKHPGYLVILFMALSKLGVVSSQRAKEKREEKVCDEAIFSRFA